jgi:hypothetical protein
MVYRLLADAVVLVHLAFVLFVALGGVLVVRRRRVAWLHVPAVLWGVWVELAGWTCPLTPLENRLCALGGAAGDGTGFIERYVRAVIYPAGFTRASQVALGLAVLVLNALVYASVLRARRFPVEPSTPRASQ